MRTFDTEVQKLKYKVNYELVKLAKEDRLDQAYYEIPRIIAPGPKATMRCCIYKERAIVEERLKIIIGDDNSNDSVVRVIDLACDECPAGGIVVTEACRGCIAHRCQTVCPKEAIHFEDKKAEINSDKCIECGRCINVCPFNAIRKNIRPCISACKAGALTIDEDKKAKISTEKCIDCGACVHNCPFGAIVDKSYILDAVNLLRESKQGENYKVYAAIAPAIVSQFTNTKIEQVIAGLKALGFYGVVEVALGADMVADKEAKELAEKGFLTSSCCPSFVKYIEVNHPDLVKHISHNASPMIEIARFIKNMDESAKVVFIGPCIGKKAEYRKEEYKGVVDCVLTFEELHSLLDGMGVNMEELPEQSIDNASYFGRIFARSGGLSEAVKEALMENEIDFEANPEVCDGLEQCKVALMKASKGMLDKNFIEGMACEGGCINGAACFIHAPKNKLEVNKYAMKAKDKTIKDAILRKESQI